VKLANASRQSSGWSKTGNGDDRMNQQQQEQGAINEAQV
jgi:hypothetical protein